MNLIRFLCFFTTIVSVAKSSAEADDVSLLTKVKRLFDSKHLLRGSGLNSKRMLEVGTKRLLQLIEINFGSININIDSININIGCNDFNNDDESSNPPMNELVKFVASDGSKKDYFGRTCSISKELILIGTPAVDNDDKKLGAAYLFHTNGTEILKLTPQDNRTENDLYSISVSIDEKIVVGFCSSYVEVFSRNGTSERTIRCNDCFYFGTDVATLGNKIVISGRQKSIWKLFIYSTEDGQLLKVIEQEDVEDVAMSEKFIVSTSYDGKTFIYNNTSPDFPKVAEINQGGWRVAVSNDRIVIGHGGVNSLDGAAWLYKTDGTFVETLDRQDASSDSFFGGNVAITDDKIYIAAHHDDEQGNQSGSVFIYSAVTGKFLKKAMASDGGGYNDNFGDSVCASDSYFVVGAPGDDDVDTNSGAAYLFQLSE